MSYQGSGIVQNKGYILEVRPFPGYDKYHVCLSFQVDGLVLATCEMKPMLYIVKQIEEEACDAIRDKLFPLHIPHKEKEK